MGSAVAGASEITLVPPGAGGGGVRLRSRRSVQASRATSAAAAAPELTVDQRVGRAAWRGVLVGLAGMTVLATGLGLATGFDLIDSLGLGAFAGVWGGPGFGGMLGAILAYVHAEDRAHEHDGVATEAGDRGERPR